MTRDIYYIYSINNTNAHDINNMYNIPLKTLYNWENDLRTPSDYIILLLEICEVNRKVKLYGTEKEKKN